MATTLGLLGHRHRRREATIAPVPKGQDNGSTWGSLAIVTEVARLRRRHCQRLRPCECCKAAAEGPVTAKSPLPKSSWVIVTGAVGL